MLEHYLIEQKDYIIAIDKLSRMIDILIKENYYGFIKGNVEKKYIDEIIAINKTICVMAYFMRLKRLEYYKQVDESYSDDFNFDETD